MKTYKVSELEACWLDAAVAKAEGRCFDMVNVGKRFELADDRRALAWAIWNARRSAYRFRQTNTPPPRMSNRDKP